MRPLVRIIRSRTRCSRFHCPAKVELVVADDGSCSVYASGSNTERQELCKADSVKAMFEIYYENNWIDKDGNVLHNVDLKVAATE